MVMKKYIVVDDRFKIGQYLLGIAESLMAVTKSVKILSEKDVAVSPTEKKPYNETTQKAIRSESSTRIENIDDLIKNI
jgi:hypothetical protein